VGHGGRFEPYSLRFFCLANCSVLNSLEGQSLVDCFSVLRLLMPVRQLLKIRTKEVLYEKYRTEKLLARRATANISNDQRQRLLEGAFFSLTFLYGCAHEIVDLGL
jgi:hypothetical protein